MIFFFLMRSSGYKIYLHMVDPRTNMYIPWGVIGSCLCAFESVALARLAFQPNALVSKVILWAYISKHVNIRTKKKCFLFIFWVCSIFLPSEPLRVSKAGRDKEKHFSVSVGKKFRSLKDLLLGSAFIPKSFVLKVLLSSLAQGTDIASRNL